MTMVARSHRGIDAWRDDLPVSGPLISLGEGETPLIALTRIGARIGLPHLAAKLEGMNPTGSYKDRIAAVSMTLARQQGKRGWIATSSGNGGMALAAYGARAGLPGILFAVPDMPREKLLPLLALGVDVHPVKGVGAGGTPRAASDMFDAVRRCAGEHDLFLGVTAHAFNAEGMRGVDTIGYELHRDAADARAVYAPTGGGGMAAAIARGLSRMGSRAALVVCQPAGCAPIADYLAGAIDAPRIARCDTQISGLQLPDPPDGQLAADQARRSGGWGTAVDDGAIHDAQTMLARTEGVFVEPASATALAAAIRDRREGRLGPEDRVILILTGAGLKDLRTVEAHFARPDPIEPQDIAAMVAESMAGAFQSSLSQ